jgi:ssRNA-specific RNase YbeY (16S rRNA maturation enzyme)
VGDVAISVERAMSQAPDGVAEVRLLAVHGLLHCLGHDHGVPHQAAAMTTATRMLLPDADVPELVTAEPAARS